MNFREIVISNGYIFSLGSVCQIVIAIVFLFLITFLLVIKKIKKKIGTGTIVTKKDLCIEILKILFKLIKQFFCRSSGRINERLKKAYQYIISAYGDAIEDKAIIGLGVAVFISIVFLLIVNAVWEFLYNDIMFLTLDSQLSSGDSIELFVETVLSLLLAIMTWRLDSQLRKQDKKEHKRELESKLKRELASNELKATISYREINNVFYGRIIIKNKNNSTIFPPFFSIKNGSVKCEFKDCTMLNPKATYNVDSICINFEQSCASADVEHLFYPICYCMLETELKFVLELEFSVFDISSDIENNKSNKDATDTTVKSSHILKVSSPLKQFANQDYGFECDVISNLI